MISYVTLLREKVINGQQIGALRLIASGVAVPKDLISLIKTPHYKHNHPRTYEQLKNLVDAYGRYLGPKPINQMSEEEKTQALYNKIKSGKQISALALIAHGARFNAKIVNLLENQTFQNQHRTTYIQLKPYLESYKQQYNAGLIPTSITTPTPIAPPVQANVIQPAVAIPEPVVVMDEQPNDQINHLREGYFVGDGGFGALGLSHSKIQGIKQQTQNNPILSEAYHLLEGYDHAQLNDVDHLTNFLHHSSHNDVSVSSIIQAMKEDRIRCKAMRPHLKDSKGSNMTHRHAIRSLGLDAHDDSATTDWNMLDSAIKMLNQNPRIADGILPKPFCEYRGFELCTLKTALVYSAMKKGATEEDLKALKGFYRMALPNTQAKTAANGMQTKCGNTLYVPSSGYFFNADQRLRNENGDDAIIADCSGTITNIIRDYRPELTWFKDHRISTWHLQYAHDALMMNANAQLKGPIIDPAGHRRSRLTQYEKSCVTAANGKQAQRNLLKAFDVVKNRDDLKAGDVILWRKPNGQEGGGHVGIVTQYQPGSNKVTIMHDTFGHGRFGIGMSEEKVYKANRETRLLRFR